MDYPRPGNQIVRADTSEVSLYRHYPVRQSRADSLSVNRVNRTLHNITIARCRACRPGRVNPVIKLSLHEYQPVKTDINYAFISTPITLSVPVYQYFSVKRCKGGQRYLGFKVTLDYQRSLWGRNVHEGYTCSACVH